MASGEKPAIATYRSRMDKAVAALKDEFGSLRTGRASAGLLDQVMVDAYGSSVPLNTLGSVSVPEPRSISVTRTWPARCRS
ncbi:MAG: ribosome recycling factor [Caulobacteraceae bacterium]|nr:ribosome recycling factor [Caulobacteraceae bacterium]